MKIIQRLSLAFILFNLMLPVSFAECTSSCCLKMGGIRYCDSSAGRYVCNNGEYSVCYCTRHAIMDLQKLQGCCLWQGGVLKVDIGLVICNDGSLSEICGLRRPAEKAAAY